MPLSDLMAALRWWATLVLIGAAATPLTLHLFRRLAERGYAFAKLVGLLMTSYLFWLLSSLGLLANDLGGLLFALLLVASLSIWAHMRSGGEELAWLRQNVSQVIITELVFSLVFALWVWARSQNPAIAATEKPMEFAFLNAVGRSPSFPPIDPWLSGFAISYYYFGYVMASALARLAAVSEPVAFNLMIAWLVAGTAVAAFGLVYNLVAADGSRRVALLLGLAAAVALPITGNLEIGLEVLHANGIGSDQFWEQLDVRDLNEPAVVGATPRYETASWWWWRSSRVIHEYHLSGRPEEGLEPIAEFPGFSFVLGDMHPHVLALPFAFLSLAVALSWWLRGLSDPSFDPEEWTAAGWPQRLRLLIDEIGAPFWIFTAIVLGGLSFLNTWDVLIHLFIILGAFLLGRWRRLGWQNQVLSQTLAVALLLLLPAILLYLPFYIGFRSQAGAPFLLPMLMRPTRLVHFLIIFGMPLWSIIILLLSLGSEQKFRRWRTGLAAAGSTLALLLLLMLFLGWVIASSAAGSAQVIALASELNLPLSPRPEGNIALGWGIAALARIAPAVLAARITTPGVWLLLGGLLGMVAMVWIAQFKHKGLRKARRPADTTETSSTTLPFVLLLIATGALLTLAPEFVYIRDNFGQRLNTVFKFYYQAWVLFGVAALFALHYLWHNPHWRGKRLPAAAAGGGYFLLLAVSLLFPYYAIRSRAAEYRGPATAEVRQPPTLDGMIQLQRFNPDEYAALTWLRENVSGVPVIVEAVGGQYTGFARVSANTGLPTILGWAGHELQWRGFSNPEPGDRDPVVRNIYSPNNWQSTAALLDQYEVEYIYVGNLELGTYGPQVKKKFDGRLPVAYANNSVTIYRWQPK